jgi:tetratricopeptide (TPR) repeat protein
MLEEAVTVSKTSQGVSCRNTLNAMRHLAVAYIQSGKAELALPIYQEMLATYENTTPPSDFMIQTSTGLADAALAANRPEIVVTICELGIAKLGSNDPHTLDLRGKLAIALFHTTRTDRDITLFREVIDGLREQLGPENPRFVAMLAQGGRLLLDRQEYAEAEGYLRELLDLGTASRPDAWTTFNTQSMLGAALLGQKKYVDAEFHLASGYEGMKLHEEKIAPQAKVRVAQALERLVQLYEVWGKPMNAAKWQAELEAYKKSTDVLLNKSN